MTERPIIFSAPMVRALLAGTKTQTRRVLKLVPPADADQVHTWFAPPHVPTEGIDNQWAQSGLWAKKSGRAGYNRYVGALPYRPGDRLWVRESYWIATEYSYGTTPGGDELEPPALAHRSRDPVFYAADGEPPNCRNRHYGPQGLRNGAYAAPDPYAVWQRYPSIHMPRWASRITLAVTDVRVERLQAISKADVMAEGVRERDGLPLEDCHAGWHEPFAALWNSINGDGAWDANPWVVALTFTVEPDRVR